jgi:cytochrome oxidase Cu insertion factor (SCO1/SenC/PrrC family)
MNRKKMLIAVAAVALGIAGAVSSAQAGNDKDEYDHGGIKIGPLGQTFGAPPASEVFASAPLTTKHIRGKRAWKDQRD